MAPGELPKYRRSLSPNIVSDAKKIRNESKEKKERKKERERTMDQSRRKFL
jgi:hypothetical protein